MTKDLPQMTVGDLKKAIADLPDKMPVRMVMDWTQIDEVSVQYDDTLGEVTTSKDRLILLNSHFK